MSSIKKLMCNPPAEMVASTGDYKIQGLFSGAGDALKYMMEEGEKYSGGVIDEFTKRIVGIEERYMSGRQVVADNTEREMNDLIKWIVTATREDNKDNGKDKHDRWPGGGGGHSLDGE